MKRAFRYLRITFSATCLIACVLLIVLWVRSYYFADVLFFKSSKSRCMVLGTMNGSLAAIMLPSSAMPPNTNWWLGYHEFESKSAFAPESTIVPIWSFVILSTVLAAAPWICWRFSLRTLLIATTLVAVVLGLIVWAMR